MSRAAPAAQIELARHLARLPRTMDKGLFHPDLEDRQASWFLATFQDAAHDVLQSKLDIEERVPSQGNRVGSNSMLFRALRALTQHYSRPHAASEMRALVATFQWAGSVAETRVEFDALWTQAEVVAENTADLTALTRFPTPAWETWLRDVLHPVFPAWAAQLASEQPAEFAGADTAWDFLHRHEPQTARQPQMARGLRSLPAAGDAYADLETFCFVQQDPNTGLPWPDGQPRLMALPFRSDCWRCGSPHHRLYECRADKSTAEQARQPRPWPLMPRNRAQHLEEEPPRPATAPALYERPGPHGPATGRDTFMGSVQAMPTIAPSDIQAIQSGQLKSLQDTQASQTLILQQLSTLLASQMPASVAVPYPHGPDSAALHQLASSSSFQLYAPPAYFGPSCPGSNYVSVPTGTSVWLRTDVAEASMDAAEQASLPTAAESPAARRQEHYASLATTVGSARA